MTRSEGSGAAGGPRVAAVDAACSTWERTTLDIKAAWPDLTDADFAEANRSEVKLYGIIQTRFGVHLHSILAMHGMPSS